MYGVGGERRLTEESLDYLEGYRGARPVRVGNAAAGQLQLDMYGELLELSWRWHRRGNSPDEDYWRFLVELVDAAERWAEPDQGLWEMRGEPQHFVHSKVMCWATLNRGLRLAQECLRKAPETRWKKVREEIREAIESEGYDEGRGVFTQSFGGKDLDAALLLIPRVDFIDYRDERMLRTTNATARTSTTRAFSNATVARASRKAPFSPAPSGWSSAWLIRDVPRTHRRSSTVRLPYPMISASSQKSTTRKRGSRWATSPRASRISPTSPPP
jgi:GH15 family glucan-1,4-alpha-glucosidase